MLGFLPLPRTLEAALRDVEHARLDVRLSALKDLRRLARDASEPALRALQSRLSKDPEPAVRAEAALALADAEAHAGLLTLLGAAADTAPQVRQMALLAIGELAEPGNVEAIGVVQAALEDAAPAIRYQALVALARLAGVAAADAMVGGTRDRDPELRHVALRVAEEVFGASAELAPPLLLQRAKAALRDDDRGVQLAAALFLVSLREPSGVEKLVEIVDDGRRVKHIDDEILAIELCAEQRLTAAKPGLERRAFGFLARGAIAWHARVALAELGDERARRLILRGLSAWSRDARTLAVAAAGRARLIEARPVLLAMAGDAARAEPEAVDEALAAIDQAVGSA